MNSDDEERQDVAAAAEGLEDIDLNEFFERFQDNASDYIRNAYLTKHPLRVSIDGQLTTLLATEVFSLINTQGGLISDYIVSQSLEGTDAGATLTIEMVRFIIENLKCQQLHFRDIFLNDLESCCAAANDLIAMAELTEEFITSLEEKKHFGLDPERALLKILKKEVQELICLYSSDAVYAAQATYKFVFAPIRDSIALELFGHEWEDVMTHNELALSLVRTIDDFLGDTEIYLCNDFLSKKMTDALVTATVVFYVECLLLKAKDLRRLTSRETTFNDPERAVLRMHGDITIFDQFFATVADRMPALAGVVHKEFEPLFAVRDYLSVVVNPTKKNIEEFVFVLHKHSGEFYLTKRLLCDLTWLINPEKEQTVLEAVNQMRKDLLKVKSIHDLVDDTSLGHRNLITEIRLDKVLKELYDTSGKVTQKLLEAPARTIKTCTSTAEKIFPEMKQDVIRTNRKVVKLMKTAKGKVRDIPSCHSKPHFWRLVWHNEHETERSEC